MKVESINFVNDLEDIDDIFDDNLNVEVTLEDGQSYFLIVGTPKNLLTLMDNEKSDFLSPGEPIVIVKKMTKQIIEDAIQAYAEDNAYYLKFYAAQLDSKTLDVLNDCYIAKRKFLDELIEKGESLGIGNYNLIDFHINNL